MGKSYYVEGLEVVEAQHDVGGVVVGFGGNQFRGSSRALRLVEQEHRRECRSHNGQET